MSNATAHTNQFYLDVIKSKVVFCIRDENGIPAPSVDNGKRSMPFWSTKSRARKIIEHVSAYKGFSIFKIPLDDFLKKWLSGLEKDGLLVGLNWSGKKAMGYDSEPTMVKRSFEHPFTSK